MESPVALIRFIEGKSSSPAGVLMVFSVNVRFRLLFMASFDANRYSLFADRFLEVVVAPAPKSFSSISDFDPDRLPQNNQTSPMTNNPAKKHMQAKTIGENGSSSIKLLVTELTYCGDPLTLLI